MVEAADQLVEATIRTRQYVSVPPCTILISRTVTVLVLQVTLKSITAVMAVGGMVMEVEREADEEEEVSREEQCISTATCRV